MPQLNPTPWFITMLTTWTIILLIMTPMLLKTQLPHHPNPNKATMTPNPWTWPWY